MAVVASQFAVAAIEGEPGMQVVIEVCKRPVAGVMAPGTFVAQRVPVRIIICVTDGAVRRCIVETVGRMAFAARHGGVQARQREPGQIVIEPPDKRPVRLLMACGTVLTELPGVRIVNRVAVPTSGQHLAHRSFLVAGVAGEGHVRAFQRKPSGRMDKRSVRPNRWLMTALALAAIAPLVIIVDGVAIVARLAKRVLEIFSRVTVGALQPVVSAAQRESRRVVIKSYSRPGRCRMAVTADVAVLAGVNVVNGVAACAALWRRKEIVIAVAVVARDIGVAPGQRVVRLAVVEGRVLPVS